MCFHRRFADIAAYPHSPHTAVGSAAFLKRQKDSLRVLFMKRRSAILDGELHASVNTTRLYCDASTRKAYVCCIAEDSRERPRQTLTISSHTR